MNSDDLVRKLNSVGKRVFVEYFDLFKLHASGRLTRADGVAALVDAGVSNDSGAAIRVGNAKLIFDNCRELDALRIVANSKRMPATVIQEARRLISVNDH